MTFSSSTKLDIAMQQKASPEGGLLPTATGVFRLGAARQKSSARTGAAGRDLRTATAAALVAALARNSIVVAQLFD